ncbi:MAG: hypothetical protein ACRD2T_05825 [Thermoanaerobaculia bacterium]
MQAFAHLRFTPGHLAGGTVEVVDESTGQTRLGLRPCGFPDPALGQT